MFRALCVLFAVGACGRYGFTLHSDNGGNDGGTVDAVDAPDHPNRAFITSTTYPGSFGGLAVADAACQARADAAGLGGTFIALLRTSANGPIDRLVAAGSHGWVDVVGVPIVDQPSDWLDGHLRHPLRRDESGTLLPYGIVWLGYPGGTCSDWTSALVGDHGGVVTTLSIYNEYTYSSCSAQNALVCAEVGHRAPVPEPLATGRYAFLAAQPWMPGPGRAAADAQCQADATAAGLPGSYLAYLATASASAASRFSTASATWVRPDGLALAPTADAVLGAAPTDLDSFFAITAAGVPNATSTAWTGELGSTCMDWTSSSSAQFGGVGDTTSVSASSWRHIIDGHCSETRGLLCLQQ